MPLPDRFDFGKHPFSVLATNTFAFVFAGFIAYLCHMVSPQDELARAFNLLVAVAGGLVGWALGMFFAPYTDKEAATFASIGRTVSAFVSGYVISKLDRFLELSLFQDQGVITIAWVRCGLFCCATLLTMLLVFTNRAYFGAGKSP